MSHIKSLTSDFDALHDINPSQHFYQFYKNTDDYMLVMSQYFRAGLEKGQACVWIVSEKVGVESANVFLDTMIPRFLYYKSSNQMIIRSAQEWYLTDGNFDEAKALNNAQDVIEGMFKKGYHCVRGAGDVGVLPKEDWPKLEAYEKKIHELVKGAPIIGLCAYPILDCSLRETRMVLDCHDDVLVGKF